MAMWERQKLCPKGPSFSSSLLDAIYRSIDETNAAHRRNTARKVEDDIESLRRAMVIEKWIENQYSSMPRHFPSNSASSTDSSVFSSSETESSASRSSPKASKINLPKRKSKIYGDLKKVKEPISPGGKISNFFNSIFSPRNLKSTTRDDEWSSMRKSRSMKDTTTTSSRSCLTKNASSRPTKSKRSVRFCPVSVVVHQDKDDFAKAAVGSQFIKKNIDSFRLRDCYHHSERDFDDMSCASSDLFELENIGRAYEEELPVYETTSLEMNQSIGGAVLGC